MRIRQCNRCILAVVLANEMRAKRMAIFQLNIVVSLLHGVNDIGTAKFVNTFAAPIAIQNIKYWFFTFFVFWDTFGALFIYFFLCRNKGTYLGGTGGSISNQESKKSKYCEETDRKGREGS